MSTNPEYVVLLSEAGMPIGREAKSRVHHAETPLHLAFSIFLFDRQGRALFQQRAFHKPTWPGVWSNTCCGHPAPGESLPAAARRRLAQELGIYNPGYLHLALPRFRYRARWNNIWENEVCPVFIGHYDGPISPDPDEVAAVRWIDWAEFSAAARTSARAIPPPPFADFSPWSRQEAAQLAATALPLLAPTALAS